MQSQNGSERRAWIVMLTRTPSYLCGVLVLAHTLRKVKSRYPLVCAVDPLIDPETRDALRKGGCQIRDIELLSPTGEIKYIAERFQDTWTKLTVFDMQEYDKVIMIDADMIIRHNFDDLFDLELPDNGNGIASVHTCVCNTPKQWCPPEWSNEKCCYSSRDNPKAAKSDYFNDPAGLINSGLVVLKPDSNVFKAMVDFLHTSPLIKDFICPDQDYLAYWFRERWINIGMEYNAIKTARYWHTQIWDDEKVIVVHYIVDKPWKSRKAPNPDDQETHGWWWQQYDDMCRENAELAIAELANV